ncbi:MAG: OmpA family protein [Cytophagales bacterium]|nr:OmpA family protein [Rhizobacter sp.]
MRLTLTTASKIAAAALLLAGTCATTWAEETTLLKGNKVTESNLLDALTPEPAPVLTRSLKISRSTDAVLAPKKKPSASLLITFETNSSDLTGPAKQQLDVVAAALKNDRLAEYSFNVEGHADPRGLADANLLLSQQRAESVRAYLVATHSIAAERLKAEGKGDTDLLNRKVPAAPENRRVTIVTNTQ